MGATNVQIKWNKTTNVQDSTSIVLFLNECVERERQRDYGTRTENGRKCHSNVDLICDDNKDSLLKSF